MSVLRDGVRGLSGTLCVLVLGEEGTTAALERAGHVVSATRTIDAAIEELADGRFDCLLIDASQPRNVDRLDRLRSEEPTLPIVAFCETDAAARAATDAGVGVVRGSIDAFSEGELLDELASVLDRRAERDEAARHEAIADLGRYALEGAAPAEVTKRAVALVADTLPVEYCGAFELAGETLVLRGGVGWESEAVDAFTLEPTGGSQAGRALSAGEPAVGVLDPDGTADDPLASRGVKSGISVVVGPAEEPWGVLGAYATDRRTFDASDVGFVRSVATVLAGAVDRERADRRRLETELEEVYSRVTDAFLALDTDGRVTHLNDRAEQLLGLPRERLVGTVIWEPFPDAFEETFREDYWEAMERQEPIERERYYPFLDRWYEGRAYPSDSGLSVYFRDVTERKRAERALREERTLKNRIVETSPTGIAVADGDGRMTLVNERAEEIFGRSEEELLGRSYDDERWNLVDWDGASFPTEELPFARVKRSGTPVFDDRLCVDGPDGQRIWLSVNCAPLFDATGEFDGVVYAFEDVTDRRRLESELEELLGRVTDSFFGLDDEWRFTYLNERAEELINPEGGDLLGENVWEQFPEAIGTTFEEEYRRAIETQRPVTFEEYYPEPLDAWFKVNAYPSETGLSVYFDEITDRKERERELELFQTLVDHSTDAIYVNDPETGEFLDVNETAARHLGYTREELLGMTVPDVDLEIPTRTAWRETVEEIRTRGRQTVDTVHQRKDGSTYPAEVNASYVGLEGGQEYVVAVGRDVTERKAHERELEQRVRQQRAVADLGQRALKIDDLDALFLEASELVASVLDNEYCKVLDLDAERRELLLRQGVGWRDGIAGSATVAADENSQAGYTLLSKEPVIVDDLDAETRFSGPDLLTSHGVVSGVSVIIGPIESPWGILGTHDTERRAFTTYDANFVQSVANVLANAINRIGRERELERYETIVETVNDGIYVIDEAGRFTTVNETYASMLGYDREELVGEHASLVVDDAVVDAAQEIERTMRAGEIERPSLEATIRGRNEERFEVEATFALLSDADGNRERVGVVRDITERKRIERELRLSAETLHELYDLTSAPELPFEEKLGRVLEAGCKRLDLEYGIFTRIEDDTMTIVQSHADHELYQPGASCPLSQSYCRRVLEEEGLVVVDDALAEGWSDDPAYETFELGTYVGGQIVVDGEVYGTICFSSSDPREEPLSEIERTFVELVNGWVSYELERTENQRELERQREQLAALDQLNTVIRDISHSILETASREEIEAAVCERLAERYRFAWIGVVERGGNAVVPTAAAGVEKGYLDEIDISLDRDDPNGRGPTAEAIRSREPQFHTNVLEDPAYEPWHEAARERGYRSSAAIPIQHEGSLYGVLNVYSPCPEAFDDSERDVLAHLGEIVGHTVYAVEQRKALTSDAVLELEFRLDEANHPLVEAASEEGIEITVERLIPGADGSLIQFVTVRGMAPAAFVDAIERYETTERATLLSEDDDGSLFEMRASDGPLGDALAGFGGRIASVRVAAGEFRVIAELPPDADVRAVMSTIESVSGGAELLAQRTETRDGTTRERLHDVLTDRLTEKQRAALETSYFAGYFDWPRNHTGEEVAEMLGLSPATLAQHLRIAERKLFEALFAGG